MPFYWLYARVKNGANRARRIRMFIDVLAVMLGGALGSLCRYLIGILVYGERVPSFPYATLVVNLLGCFVIGICASFFVKHPEIPMYVKLFAITGILGGLTTYGTFTLETYNLLYENPILGIINIGSSLLGGLCLVALGMKAAG
jgi:CrcB protein